MLTTYTVYVVKFEMSICKENNKIKLESVIQHQTGQLLKWNKEASFPTCYKPQYPCKTD